MRDGFWFVEKQMVPAGIVREWQRSRPRGTLVATTMVQTSLPKITRTAFTFALEGSEADLARRRQDVAPAPERSVAARIEHQLRFALCSRVTTADMGPLDNPRPLSGTTAVNHKIPPRLDEELPCRLGRVKSIVAIMSMQDSNLGLYPGSHLLDATEAGERVVTQPLRVDEEQIVPLPFGDVLVMDARLVVQFFGSLTSTKTEQFIVVGCDWPGCSAQPEGHVAGSDTTLQYVTPIADYSIVSSPSNK